MHMCLNVKEECVSFLSPAAAYHFIVLLLTSKGGPLSQGLFREEYEIVLG